jgi:hypothetical protein
MQNIEVHSADFDSRLTPMAWGVTAFILVFAKQSKVMVKEASPPLPTNTIRHCIEQIL